MGEILTAKAARDLRRGYGLLLRLRLNFERRLGRQVQALLSAQAPGIGAAVRASDPLGAIGVRLARDVDPLARDLRASYVAAGTATGEARSEVLGARRFLPETVVAFAREHGLDRAVRISRTTQQIAQRVLDRGLREGVPTLELASRLERETRALSRPRSIVIARTEVGIAASFGDFTAADQASRGDMVKVWLTARDGGERHPSEPGLEGQEREMDEPFDVRGFEGMHPHALELPASEVVNCRCALGYRRR